MSCRFCGGPTAEAFVTTDRNRAVSSGRFRYELCADCGTYSLANVPADLGRYYGDAYYELPPADEIDLHARAEAPKLSFVSERVPSGSLVEIGAGFGLFSRAARNAGYDVTAIEMDARCCDYIETVVGVPAVRSDDPARALRGLAAPRAVAMWHVLEHLPDPAGVLEAIAERLEPGGVLAVALPNPQSLQFRLLRGRWAHVDAPRHVSLIPAAALTERARSLGLRRVAITTSDPAGRHWNWFGWEYAVRRFPAATPSSAATTRAALALTAAAAPFERRGLNGTAYTAVFTRD